MSQRNHWFTLRCGSLVLAATSCTVPNPNYRPHVDGGGESEGSSEVIACDPNQPLRCDGANLVRCGATGDSEVREPCSLGCGEVEKRCLNMTPSNGLVAFFDQAASETDLDLGNWATINTDTGAITVDSLLLVPPVTTEIQLQTAAPSIRVLIVRSLKTNNVDVVGKNALAVVSHGDIAIQGAFTVTTRDASGAGAFNRGNCKGAPGIYDRHIDARGGSGGGGFGTAGAAGGGGMGTTNTSIHVTQPGSAGGVANDDPTLVPLRGGCDGGGDAFGGHGGGALQLVSRTSIVVTGVVAANGGGAGGDAAGGGSGGGILLEAPIVEVTGRVAANGGGGGGCGVAFDGGLDDKPARGSLACTSFYTTGAGGNGAAGQLEATPGTTSADVGGGGGGGAGRIRVNTARDSHRTTERYSPTPTIGELATR